VARSRLHPDHRRYLHHLVDFADRAALDVLDKAASKTLTKRARKLPNLDSLAYRPERVDGSPF